MGARRRELAFMALLALVVGCTSGQIYQLRTDEQSAEQFYSATTQATAAALGR